MCGNEFAEKIKYIVVQLREAGYEPYNQLAGYVLHGNLNYITRRGNARELIKEPHIEEIKTYLKQREELE